MVLLIFAGRDRAALCCSDSDSHAAGVAGLPVKKMNATVAHRTVTAPCSAGFSRPTATPRGGRGNKRGLFCSWCCRRGRLDPPHDDPCPVVCPPLLPRSPHGAPASQPPSAYDAHHTPPGSPRDAVKVRSPFLPGRAPARPTRIITPSR
ncbi:hypothetical protein SEVIR_3G230451v4 [Setaria viridis]